MSVADVRGLFFLDTNVLVYTFDASAPEKRATAREWVRTGLSSQRGVIGTQVVQEFMNVALSRFARPMGVTEARDYLRGVLQPLCRHVPSSASYDHALLVKEETGYSWYDALIVTAAIETGCKWLVTEDMDHGRTIGSLTIRNPFGPG